MEIETSLVNISGTWYVRIPASFSEYFKLGKDKPDKCKIRDEINNSVVVTFPSW